MIDVHSHILFGLDDGASTLEESLAMLRVAARYGTTDIVATPHANSTYSFDPARNAALREEISVADPKLPRIHLGCDFHLAASNIQEALHNHVKFTVNCGNYLMVELPDLFEPSAMDEVFRRFANIQVTPVITHPERNPVLQSSPEILARWISQGCRSQLTAMSLTGGFGNAARTSAWLFLRAGHAHMVASDAHDPTRRPPRLDAARKLVEGAIGEERAALLFVDHPRAVIENCDIPMHVEPYKPRKWFQFW